MAKISFPTIQPMPFTFATLLHKNSHTPVIDQWQHSFVENYFELNTGVAFVKGIGWIVEKLILATDWS